jgi:hypothetical protein
MAHRMRKKAVQQGRSERRGESYSAPYVEPLSDARTPLADFFRILLEGDITSASIVVIVGFGPAIFPVDPAG